MRTWADSTLMNMKKSDLIEILRCAEHNQAVAEEQFAQHIEKVKGWVPVVRCKDCKYCRSYMSGNIYCVHSEGLTSQGPDAFCSYGELKEHTHGES